MNSGICLILDEIKSKMPLLLFSGGNAAFVTAFAPSKQLFVSWCCAYILVVVRLLLITAFVFSAGATVLKFF